MSAVTPAAMPMDIAVAIVFTRGHCFRERACQFSEVFTTEVSIIYRIAKSLPANGPATPRPLKLGFYSWKTKENGREKDC
jgi:hypothetical protein